MKKENYVLIAIIAVAVSLTIIGGMTYKSASGNNGTFNVDKVVIFKNATSTSDFPFFTFYPGNANQATTTFTNMMANTTATTSIVFNIDKAQSVDINMAFVATTTTGINPTLAWSYDFSYDGTNFYSEDLNTTSGSVVTHNGGTASSSPTIHIWTPGIATTTAWKNVHVNPSGTFLGEKWMRLNISSWVAPSRWWGEAIIKRAY